MIKLTTFYYDKRLTNKNNEPLWINPRLIASISVSKRMVIRSDADVTKPVGERPTETYTIVGFAACGSEGEQLCELVQETPKEILELIYLWEQDQKAQGLSGQL